MASPRSTGTSTRPLQARVLLEPHRMTGHRHQPVGQLADGQVAARADVVGLARLAVLDQQPVGPHDVAHVGEVAAGGQVADRDDLGAVELVEGDALGDGRRPRTGWSARARGG